MENTPLLSSIENASRPPVAFVPPAPEKSIRRRVVSCTNDLRRFAGRLTAVVVVLAITAYLTFSSTSQTGSRESPARHARPVSPRIFFVHAGLEPKVSARFSCAVESAAAHHPHSTVHVLAATGNPLGGGVNSSWPDGPFVRMLSSLPNVVFGSVQASEEFRDTPLESWYSSAAINRSVFYEKHLSGALRLAVLFKRGGVFLDEDTVTMKPLSEFRTCVSQKLLRKGDSVGNSFLFFEAGHAFLRDVMERAASDYDPARSSCMGPDLLRDVLLERCGVDSVAPLASSGRRCKEVLVLPAHVLMPVPWTAWKQLFDACRDSDWDTLRSSHAVCFYRGVSSGHAAAWHSAYWRAASDFCPRSLDLSLEQSGGF
ncbi:lactosylceramide 4-alpha-galactosyltransferase-like isoform X2 [Amblyomma americanum]